MSDLFSTVLPSTFKGAICFQNELYCLEVQSCPSTLGNQIEMPIPQSRALCANISLFWGEERPLTVSFLDFCSTSSFTDEEVKGFVKAGAQDWTCGTSLSFNFLGTDDPRRDRANIRISFQGSGTYSVVGTTFVQFGQPTMNLGFKTSDTKAEIMRGVLHEFGHALGFQHEHSSPRCPLHLNREAIMKSYKGTLPNNISPEKWFDVNFAKLAMSGTIEASCFDEDSVMMYTIWPEWSQKGERIGGKLSLSKTDREMVRKWYPLRVIQPSSMPVPPFQPRSNKRLSMDSTWLTSLPQHDRPSLIDDFRGNKPEFPER